MYIRTGVLPGQWYRCNLLVEMTTSRSSLIRVDLLAVVVLTHGILAVIGYEAILDSNQDGTDQGVEEQLRAFENLISKNDANHTGMIIPKDSSQANESGMIIPKDSSQANESGMIIPKDSNQANESGMIIPKDSSHANETGMIIPKDSSQANESGMIIPKDSSQANASNMIIPKDSSQANASNMIIPKDSSQANESGMIIPKDSSQANETGMIIPKDSSRANKTGMIIPKDSSQGVKCGSYSIAPGTTIEFSTKYYPNRYPSNYKCSWLFQGTTDTIELELNCEHFNLPRCLSGSTRKKRICQMKNVLRVYGGKLRKRYRGLQGPEYVLVEGNRLFIKLYSKMRATGFSCSVTAYSTDEFETTTSASASTSCQCGRTYKRIVGGSETGVNEYPWQVGLAVAGTPHPFCGASIVGRRHVLTAAHCTKAITDKGWHVEVLVGDHDTTSNSDTPVAARIPIKAIIQHSQYSTTTLQNDISLIELESALDLDSDPRLAPVCLPPAGKLFVGANAIVAGWGRLEEGGSQPQTLYDVILPVISNEVCEETYGNAIYPTSLCAGHVEGGKDSCQGDSGGPLVTEDDSVMVQIGVVSFGFGCARPKIPGVYTRVTEYLDWIKSHTGSEDTCA